MSVALFPGKFVPPHIGHVITLLRLYEDYDRIIVGICEVPPYNLLSTIEIKDIFEEIFRYMPKYEVRILEGNFRDETVFENLKYDFDEIVTNNKNTIKLLEERDIKYRRISKYVGIGVNGTELRWMYENLEKK